MYNLKEYFSKSNCFCYLNNKKRGFFYLIVINYKVSNNFFLSFEGYLIY